MVQDKFFTREHKRIALNNSGRALKKAYKKSERELLEIAKCGDERELAEVMKKHGEFEYAMLFQKTPEFKKRRKR